MDLFNLISDPNPSKVKTDLHPRAAHEVPLLTATASRVMDMEDPDVAQSLMGHQVSLEEEVAAMGPRLSKKRRRRANDGADANAPPKVLRKDYAFARLEQSNREGKSLPTMGLAAGSTFVTPTDTKGVSGPDPMSYAEPQPHPEQSMTHARHALCEKCRVKEIDLLPIHGWVTRRIKPPPLEASIIHYYPRGRKAHLLKDKQISSVGVYDEVSFYSISREFLNPKKKIQIKSWLKDSRIIDSLAGSNVYQNGPRGGGSG
nr:hypothetical protein [Tanacetum cinerariifolium]